ncbi:MAG: hypothetical protein Q8L15_00575, partial [Methylobacter sp.]|nr:hypothetical protein [Methylobacter sp.]
FTYTVSDGKLTTTAIITLAVLPKKDHDQDHHDNGQHHGFEHSEHNGYEERCAKIIVQSAHPAHEQRSEGRQDTIIVNQHSRRTADKIDWTGQAPVLGKLKKDDWIAEQLTERPKEQSLAELTGLVVKIK